MMFKGSSLMGLAGGFIAFSTVVILLEWYAIQGIGKEEDISREEAAVALAGVDVSPPTVNNSKEAKIDKKVLPAGSGIKQQFLSKATLPHFPVPREVRHHKCIGQHHIVKDLPTVTIVMPYLNETWSQMEATLASILLYTPPELLDEILMIDDGNLEDWKFHDKLKATHPKIRVIRNEERQGLIRSKVIGAASMVSPVLVFMEPHCIVTREWLEPLLERINQHEHNIIVVPTLDIIPEHDFTQYLPANYHIGGFSWALNFMWRELITERNATYQLPEPYPTPALSGGIFAI